MSDIRYSDAAMAQAKQEFARVATSLESTIRDRQEAVAAAMAHYEATGVSDEYAAKERAWNASAEHVLGVIRSLRAAMGEAEREASDARSRVRAIAGDL